MYNNDYNGYNSYDYNNEVSINEYTSKVYYWMAAGLLVTFITSLASYYSGLIYNVVVYHYPVMYLVLIAEVVLVMVLTANIAKLSTQAATWLFFAYSVLNGFTFGLYLAVYTTTSVFTIFLLAAIFFFAMATYGKNTTTDLSAIRPYLFTGTMVLAVFWIFSMFVNLSAFERIACTIGLAIFMIYTAFDVQKIPHYYDSYVNDPEMLTKSTIIVALHLYLDFINIFVYLLRLFGRRRN